MSTAGMTPRGRWLALIPLAWLLACGPGLQHSEEFTVSRVKDMMFNDECRLQEHFDRHPALQPAEARAVSGSEREIGRLSFVISRGSGFDTFARLLRTYYSGVPPLRPDDRITATVSYVQKGDGDKAQRHMPIGAETSLEVNGRALTLPYHPCVGAFFLGADHYAMRRRALGLPAPPVKKPARDDVRDLVAEDPARSAAAAAALVKRGAAVVGELVRELALQPPAPVRRRLVAVIRAIGPQAVAAVPVILEQLDQADAALQRIAALTLLELLPAIEAVASSPDPNLRTRGAEALARLDCRQPMVVLLKSLAGADAAVRGEVWTALRTRLRVSIPALLRALRDADRAVRELAAEGLGAMAASRAELGANQLEGIVRALTRASQEDEPAVRRAAGDAVRRLVPDDAPKPPHKGSSQPPKKARRRKR